jgi:hypothetical protein
MVYAFGGISTPGANTKTANLATGTYSIVPKGTTITLYAKGSAAGINATLLVGGIPLVNDQPIINIGTTGTINRLNDGQVSVKTNGGMIELYLRNTTATAGTTCDYIVDVA